MHNTPTTNLTQYITNNENSNDVIPQRIDPNKSHRQSNSSDKSTQTNSLSSRHSRDKKVLSNFGLQTDKEEVLLEAELAFQDIEKLVEERCVSINSNKKKSDTKQLPSNPLSSNNIIEKLCRNKLHTIQNNREFKESMDRNSRKNSISRENRGSITTSLKRQSSILSYSRKNSINKKNSIKHKKDQFGHSRSVSTPIFPKRKNQAKTTLEDNSHNKKIITPLPVINDEKNFSKNKNTLYSFPAIKNNNQRQSTNNTIPTNTITSNNDQPPLAPPSQCCIIL